MSHWYVIRTHAKAEFKALSNVLRQGFNAYLPQYLRQRRHARRTDWVRRPLFPRYLFVEMDVASSRWRALRSTFGVEDLICRGNEPVPVPPGVVEGIRGREDDNGLVLLARQSPFKKGDPVRVIAGALIDQIGIFDCETDDHRVVLLLELLGRKLRIPLPIDAVAHGG